MPGVAIDFSIEHGGADIHIFGWLTPAAWQVPMSAEIRDEAGHTTTLYATSDDVGEFSMGTRFSRAPASPAMGRRSALRRSLRAHA